MAGLRDEVELDVAGALRDIDRLGAALTQQTQRFQKELAQSFDTLRGRGPTFNTDGINRARRATQGLASDVNKVKRETEGATAATGKYGRTLQAVAQIRVVQGLVAFFGGRALVDQITKTTKAYADLVQETARSEQVFEEADGAVLRFADNAVRTIGLARREAIQASSDFGTMFRDAGLTGTEAARLSEQFVRLGADLSAFANIGVPEALTKLSSGLAGEIEPLRRIGFAIGQVAAEAKATELGLERVNGQFTQGALTQARAAVILEKLAIVNGQYAREQEGLIGQQARLRAEAEQLREELGEQLQPVMLELVRSARENLPTFGALAANAIPLLISALQVLNPTAQVLLDLLVALSPILTAVGAVLDAIPAPALQIAGAFLLVNRTLGPLTSGLETLALRLLYLKDSAAGLASRGGIAAALSGINPVAAGATLGLVALTSALASHRKEQEANKRAIEETAAAFEDQSKAIREDARAATEKRLTDKNQIDDLRALGLSVREFQQLALDGASGMDTLVRKMEQLGGSQGLTLTSTRFESVTEAVRAYGSVQAAVADQAIAGNEGLIESLYVVERQLQAAAKAALDRAVVNETLTESQVKAAEAATLNADGTKNWFAALSVLEPKLAEAIAGAEGLGVAGEETASAMEELDDALSELADTIDEVFGRFLDAEDATAAMRDAAFDLASALAEGRREGESMLEFQERLAALARTSTERIIDQAEALARAGEIRPDQVFGEIIRRLEEQIELFPELREQFQRYIDQLRTSDGLTTTQRVVTIYEEQGRDAADRADQARQREAARAGREQGESAGNAITDGLLDTVEDSAAAGAEHGRRAAEEAAKEVETTLRRSGRSGLNLGGFIVEGISLGARQAEIDLRNFLNGMTQGLTGVVNDAMQIDRAEASEILQAVANMDQATRDLAEAREKLGADSIEAKIAEMELALAQEAVNDALAEAIDSTEKWQEALDKVTAAVDTMTGSLRALQSVRDAQKAAEEAGKNAADAVARLGMFDRLIAETEARLRQARSSGDTLGAARLEDALTDLRNRRGEQAEAVTDAEFGLRDAQLDLIDTQQQLVDLGGQVAGAQALWEGYFRALAEQAGLSKQAIDELVESLNVAGGVAQGIRNGVLTGQPQQVNFGLFAPPAPQQVGTVAQSGSTVKNYTFNIYETSSARATGVEVVDEIRAVELVG